MATVLMVNDQMFMIPYSRFYTPLFLIDMKMFQVTCRMSNKLCFFIENPRTNIALVSGFFDFYFKKEPDEYMLGQVLSKAIMYYQVQDDGRRNLTCPTASVDFMPCVLFTKGFVIQELLIYLPFQKFMYLRELKQYFLPTVHGTCAVCLETKPKVINLHQNEFLHCLCNECLLKIGDDCPVCRQSYPLFLVETVSPS